MTGMKIHGFQWVIGASILLWACGDGTPDTGEMVTIPAGTYTIGVDGGAEDEGPAHAVTLAAFEIDVHEVTNADFRKFVSSDDCPGPLVEGNPDPCVYDGYESSNTHEDYWTNRDYDDYPVINVRWDQAEAYCRWLGKRLPTEAEWEVAARGSDDRRYPWGDDEPTCDRVNYSACIPDAIETGSLPAGASPFGALDMSGNVAEWVQDYYNPSYYSWGETDNPTGPDQGSNRVVRGGSWFCDTSKVTVTSRDQGDPLLQYSDIGFRCARSVE